MPIRPENRERYPVGWAAPLSHFVSETEMNAITALRAGTGFDAATAPGFWENVLAGALGGATTPASHASDIDLGHFEIEVKFSSPYWMRLGQTDRRSRVFRWTALSGHGKTPKTAAITVLVGLDDERMVHIWVLARDAINGTGTATVVVPTHSHGESRSALDGYYVPAEDLLDAVLCRFHHAATASHTRAVEAAAGMEPLFDLEVSRG